MNNTFSLRRFAWLFRKTILERPVTLLGTMVLTCIGAILWYAITKNYIGYELSRKIAFSTGLIGGGALFASQTFNYFFSNAAGSAFLSLPASHLEKWTTAIVLNLVFFILFLVIFSIADVWMVDIYQQGLDINGKDFARLSASVARFDLTGLEAQNVYLFYLNISAIMLLGSLFFNKAALVKTALFICGLVIVLFFVNFIFANVLIDNVKKTVPFKLALISLGDQQEVITLPSSARFTLQMILQYLFPVLLWLVSYVRLREKEF